jgi:hypothetical protein
MTRALRMVIDGKTYWHVDDLHEYQVPERHRSMCVMQERGVCEIVEVDIRERRDTVREGCALAAGTISAPEHDAPTLTENAKPESEAAE